MTNSNLKNEASIQEQGSDFTQKVEIIFRKYFDKAESIKQDMDLKTYHTIIERLGQQKTKLLDDSKEAQKTEKQNLVKQGQLHPFFEKRYLKPKQIKIIL